MFARASRQHGKSEHGRMKKADGSMRAESERASTQAHNRKLRRRIQRDASRPATSYVRPPKPETLNPKP